MIVGKSYEDKRRILNARRKKQIGRKPYFAWLPVRIKSGKVAWLHTIYVDRGVRENQSGDFVYTIDPIFYANKTGAY